MESTMDRRSFLKGSVLAGAVASTGMLLGGCAPKKESESAVEKNGKSAGDGGAVDWLGAPQTIDEGDIAETLECDVLVIGGGLSGLCALNAAVEEGANAILIEKHSCSRYGGIFHSAIGYEKQVEAGVTLDPEEVLNNELVKYGPLCDTSFWATWAHESGAIMDWLLEKAEANGVVIGMPFTQYPEGVDPSKEPYITIPGSFTTGWDHFIEEGKEREKYLLDALTSEAVKSGAQVKYNTPGLYLEQTDNGAVGGAVAQAEDGSYLRIKAAKGVIVCTGDFAGNEDMCTALLPETIAKDMYDCNAYTSYMESDEQPKGRLDTGDGHKMCIWAGGVMEDNPVATMGWPSVAEAELLPYMGVNSIGERFANEANAFMIIGRIAYDQPCAAEKGAHFWKIVDANYAQQTADMKPICMFGVMESGLDEETMSKSPNVKADTIEELASEMEVDPEVLKASIDRYNEMVAQGFDSDFAKPSRYLYPIETAPFYAIRAQQSFIHTMSGVLCSPDLEVCGSNGAIPGLYAAGNVVGRRFGNHYEASLPGMSNAFAIVHGYLAGKHCAARR